MAESVEDFIKEQKEQILESCTTCGICIKKCPVYENTSFASAHPAKLQKEILNFLQGGEPNENIFKKTFYCMLCFKCAKKLCPKGLNPLLINYLLRHEYRERNLNVLSYPSAKDLYSIQRVLPSIQTTPEEYQRIFTQSTHKSAQYVYFPGCGVYVQPDNLLSTMEIIDVTGVDYSFLPGVENCCGINHLNEGDFVTIDERAKELIEKLTELNPQSVVFGCNTCLSLFEMIYSKLYNIPFEAISLPQFLTRNLDKLEFKNSVEKKVTLHEACKAAYMGVDVISAREILRHIPGVEFVDMEHCGANTRCCGGLSLAAYPQEIQGLKDLRLNEVKDTGADILVDVCHSCHDRFIGEEAKRGFKVESYISVVARALGIEREDKYKKYKLLGKVDKILEEADVYVDASIYPKEIIADVIEKTFAG